VKKAGFYSAGHKLSLNVCKCKSSRHVCITCYFVATHLHSMFYQVKLSLASCKSDIIHAKSLNGYKKLQLTTVLQNTVLGACIYISKPVLYQEKSLKLVTQSFKIAQQSVTSKDKLV